MKNVRHFLFAGLFATLAVNAQTTFPSPFINAPAPPSANAVATVNGTPGISQYMYVVVAHYPSGDAMSNVLVVNNGNATLSGTNKIVISWQAVPYALTYDVLRVTSNPYTYASCTCALSASATSALTLSDTGASLNAYTAGSLASGSTAYWDLQTSKFDHPQMRVWVSGLGYQANEPRGITLPTYCDIGDHFFKTNATAGQNEYLCTASNTWTQVIGGGAGTAIVTSCGTTATCAATNISATAKVVRGAVALTSGTPSTAVVTAIPAFTSTTSYSCAATNQTTQANSVKVANTSTTSITITGPNTVTDTIGYICVGN
jgi:hypothetical protein